MVKIPVGSRKIQKSTNRSYFLNLPLWWVKQNGLDKGDRVEIYRSKSGSLLLKPNYDFDVKVSAAKDDTVEEKKESDILSRLSEIAGK